MIRCFLCLRAAPFTVKSVFECAVSLARTTGTVTLCFHISIIFNILMGKCWQYFARFEMRRVCKPLFTEAGVFRQNKSSTAVSAKIKVHRFISCKQGNEQTRTKKILYRQSNLTVYWMKNINIAVGVYMNLFLKGTGLREVSTAFFPSYHCSFISATCCQRVKFSLSADFVLCRF